ncbi:MAG: hypothetical protein Q8N05_09350 [Bacteroidota bacterium]|nr:hypothetical protein [Bacteroidota bacterium]
MSLKFKIVFFNFMIFLIIFDIIYLLVWIFSVQMNPVKAVIVAGIAALLMPWIRATNLQAGKKVFVRSYATVLYRKYLKK